MKSKANLIARVFLFALTLLWVMGFLTVSFSFFPLFVDLAYSSSVRAIQLISPVWYIMTTTLISVGVAWRAYKFIGKWEKKKAARKSK